MPPLHFDTFDLMVGRMTKANDQAVVQAVSKRVLELRELNSDQLENRTVIRDIMDGGIGGLRALLGSDFKGADPRVPSANLMLSGLTRLAQKTNRVPDIRVDPPATRDSDSARKAADRRARIVASFDSAASAELQASQLARWTVGYGFTPFVIEEGHMLSGDPYPRARIRDPYNAFPGQWTIDQQPRDIAFLHIMGPMELIERFPQHADKIRAAAASTTSTTVGGSYGTSQHAGWQNQKGAGVEVYEYINLDGTWWVMPHVNLLLSFTPNPISRPLFWVDKRFAFNKLVGQYDHVIGLMAAMARLSILSIIHAEDSVFTETNISGEVTSGTYKRGRNQINHLTPGSSVDRPQAPGSFEVFQQIDRLERQLRVTAGYPVQDDGQSPMSFVTGRGLEELSGDVAQEAREYFVIRRHTWQALDSLRLEMDDKHYGGMKKTMHGFLNGASFSEKYTPSAAIDGNYITRRVTGALVGMDEPTKVVTLLNFLQNEVMDVDTVRENVDGIEDPTKVAERVRQNGLEKIVMQFLAARAEQGDVASMNAVIEMLRDGDVKAILSDVFIPDEEEQQQLEQQPAQVPAGPPPDVQTALARLTQGGETLGVQNLVRS